MKLSVSSSIHYYYETEIPDDVYCQLRDDGFEDMYTIWKYTNRGDPVYNKIAMVFNEAAVSFDFEDHSIYDGNGVCVWTDES